MKKRVLSMLLVLCMVFTLFPAAAFAAETGTPADGEKPVKPEAPTCDCTVQCTAADADNGTEAAIKQMQLAGVLAGKNNNQFDPQGTATRAEVSAVLRRFVDLTVSTDAAEG